MSRGARTGYRGPAGASTGRTAGGERAAPAEPATSAPSTSPAPQAPLRRDRIRRLLLRSAALGGATLLALLAVEAGLQRFPPPVAYMTTRNVIQRVASRPDLLLQYANRAGFSGTFANREFRTRVLINANGLRDREFSAERTPGRERLLLLGDSFVFGWGVEGEEVVAKRLEQELPGVEAINAGCSGWGTEQEVAYFRTEGLRYRPDGVLLFFCENDPSDNALRYRFEGGELLSASEPAPSRSLPGRLRRFIARRSAVVAVARRALVKGSGTEPRADDPALWQRERAALGELRRASEARGIRLGVVYIPGKPPSGVPAPGPALRPLREWCAQAGVPLLDLVAPLRDANQRRRVSFRLDDHWTPWGHAAAAAATAAWVRQLGWLGAGRAAAR